MCVPKELFDIDSFVQKNAKISRHYHNKLFGVCINIGIYEVNDVDEPVSEMCDKAYIAIENVEENSECNVAYFDNDMMDEISFEKELIKDFDTVIHFNGNSFDIPFVTERGKKYNLEFDFDNYQSIDIYKPVSKLNHILKMENNKQKSFEKLLGINRSDPFSGGDLIEVFKHYVESKDERLLFPLLLHNKEDVWNMGILTDLLSISDIFEYKYKVNSYEIHEYKNFDGDIQQELLVSITLNNAVPVNISHNFNLSLIHI